MKKLIFIVFVLLVIPTYVHAESKQVLLDSCIQADQVKFKDNDGFVMTYQFHSIISPSTKHITKGEEDYSKEALEYTCNRLRNASIIRIEEVETTAVDHGEAYVFVDDILLQEELLKLGYAKISYLEEDNPYYEILAQAELTAKDTSIGIWSEKESIEEPKEELEKDKEIQTKKKNNNPILNFFDKILDNVVAGINKMIDYILQKIDNML